MTEYVKVPEPDAGEHDLLRFALTYNGYQIHGSMDAVCRLARDVGQRWHRDGTLPDDLALLRVSLFFVQRAAHHSDGPFRSDPFVAALVSKIGELSGGTVAVLGENL